MGNREKIERKQYLILGVLIDLARDFVTTQHKDLKKNIKH